MRWLKVRNGMLGMSRGTPETREKIQETFNATRVQGGKKQYAFKKAKQVNLEWKNQASRRGGQ